MIKKTCNKCNTNKDLDCFYKSKGKPRSICKVCDKLKSTTWNKNNKEKHAQHQRTFSASSPQRQREIVNKYRKTNKYKQSSKNWPSLQPEAQSKQAKRFRAANPGYASHYANMRKKNIKLATPKWLSKAHKKEIRRLYMECSVKTQETGIQHHVDHIHPLVIKDENGNHIGSGLHVPWNLQILTAEDNLRKKCRIQT